MLYGTLALTSCTQGQIEQVLQNKTQDMISGPCTPAGIASTATPEFCVNVTDMQLLSRDTQADVSLTLVNRTGRRLFLVLSSSPYLTDSNGSRWERHTATGIGFIGPSNVPLPLEPNVETQISFLFTNKGQAPSDQTTFSMRGEIAIMKVDTRGQPSPLAIAVSRGINLSEIRIPQPPLRSSAPTDQNTGSKLAQASPQGGELAAPRMAAGPNDPTEALNLESVRPKPVNGTEELVTNREEVKRILAALDDGVWVGDGSDSAKHVYVIFRTTCGYSKRLFMDTRKLPNRPQFRWLPDAEEGRGVEMILTKRTVESVGEALLGRYAPPTDVATAKHALSINQSLSELFSGGLPSPTVIYKTPEGLRLVYGTPGPAELRTLIPTVQSRPDRAAYQPASLRWLSEPATVTPTKLLRKYFNDSATPVSLRMAPYPDAPILRDVLEGKGYDVDAVENQEWIRVNLGKIKSNNIYGYIHAPLPIKLDNLEFTVQRASGMVSTNSGTEIRSHPATYAPVVVKPGPGYQFKKTGEVVLDGHNWVEVIWSTNGKKGYIVQ